MLSFKICVAALTLVTGVLAADYGGDAYGGGPIEAPVALSEGFAPSGFLRAANCFGHGCGGAGPASLGSLPILRTPSKIDFVNVPVPPEAAGPANLLVDAHMNPISLVYRSFGAPINVVQKHVPAPPTFKQIQSEEEPSRHVHTIHKPVIQEVREIIKPMRYVRQEVLPVQEKVETIVAKSNHGHAGGFAAQFAAPIAGPGGPGSFSCSGPGCGKLAPVATRFVAPGFAGADIARFAPKRAY